MSRRNFPAMKVRLSEYDRNGEVLRWRDYLLEAEGEETDAGGVDPGSDAGDGEDAGHDDAGPSSGAGHMQPTSGLSSGLEPASPVKAPTPDDHHEISGFDSDADEDEPLLPSDIRPLVSLWGHVELPRFLPDSDDESDNSGDESDDDDAPPPDTFRDGRDERSPSGDLADLEYDLRGEDYYFPQHHLRLFLEWTRLQNLQIGIRHPYLEDITQLDTYDASSHRGYETLVWLRIAPAARILCQIMATRTGKGKAGQRELHVLTYAPPGKKTAAQAGASSSASSSSSSSSSQGSRFSKPASLDRVSTHVLSDADEIDTRLGEALDALCVAFRATLPVYGDDDPGGWSRFLDQFRDHVHNGETDQLDRFLDQAEHRYMNRVKAAGDHPRPRHTYPDIAGTKANWVDLTYINTGGEHDGLVVGLRYPVGLITASGAQISLGTLAQPAAPDPADPLVSEGYHQVRIEPDYGALSDELQEVAQRKLETQIERDHILLNAHFAAGLAPSPAGDNDNSDAGAAGGDDQDDADDPTTPRIYRMFAPDVQLQGPGVSEDRGVRKGALIFAPEKREKPKPGDPALEKVKGTGLYHIHLLTPRSRLTPKLRDALVADQTRAKNHNRLAISSISFIAGQIYKAPKRKIIKDTIGEFGWKKRGTAFLVGTVIEKGFVVAVTAVTMPFMATAAVPVATGLAKGLKRVFLGKTVYRPANALRDYELMRLYRNTLDDAGKSDFVQRTDPKADISVFDPRLSRPSQPPPSSPDEAKPIMDDALLQADEVGDVLRRSYVHFEMARQRLKRPRRNESAANRAQRYGEALHHLEKGWRYLGNTSLFLQNAWEQHHAARDDWKKYASQSSTMMIREFLRLVKEDKIHPGAIPSEMRAKDAPELPKTAPISVYDDLKEVLKPGKAYSIAYGLHKVISWFGFARKPFERRKLYKAQLALFLSQAYPNFASRKINAEAAEVDPDFAAELANPEIFAEWQTRGSTLEPYLREEKDGSLAGPKHKKGEEDDLYKAFGQIQDAVYDRVQKYHSTLRQLVNGNVDGSPADVVHLRDAIAQEPAIKEAWLKADQPGDLRRMYHDVRNWNYKLSKREKLSVMTTTTGEMVAGYWKRLDYGELGKWAGIEPSEEEKSSIRIISEEGADLFDDRIDQAARRGAIGGTIAAGKVFFKQLALKQPDKQKTGYVVEKTGILTDAYRDRVVEAQADEVGLPPPGSQPMERPKDLKTGAAYVGANLILKVGKGRQRSMLARRRFAKMVGLKFPMKSKFYQRGFDSPKYSGLKEMYMRVEPLARYYTHMDQLEGNLRLCMVYLDILAVVGNKIEKHLLDQVGALPPEPHGDAAGVGAAGEGAQ